MAKKKQFAPNPAILGSIVAAERKPNPPETVGKQRSVVDRLVRFPLEGNATGRRTFDFGRWLGQGFDEILDVFQTYVEHLLATRDGDRTVSTIAAFCTFGYVSFFEYCAAYSAALRRDLTLLDLQRPLVDAFVCHLQSSSLQVCTQRGRYSMLKATLIGLASLKFIELVPGEEGTIPPNPFPFAHRHVGSAKPLTKDERKGFTAALKTELQSLFSPQSKPSSDLLCFALLAVALRTGRNTTPLLELSPDCLHPHPKKDMRILVCYKRRGATTHKVPLRTSEEVLDASSVLPDVARVLIRTRELSEPLRPRAPEHLKNRLWLFESRRGEISTINDQRIGEAIRKLVGTYSLQDSDGKPLTVTITRLRKTFGNRVFELLDGNLAGTARALGNTVQVADTNYLAPSPEAAANWRFMGDTLAKELLEGNVLAHRTPAARCADPLNGQLAPKNGRQCTNFLACLRCKSVVITGDPDDLYRLFSFYRLVAKERGRTEKAKWQKHYAQILRIIDRDVVEAGIATGKLESADVERARAKAFASPHPYWALPSALET